MVLEKPEAQKAEGKRPQQKHGKVAEEKKKAPKHWTLIL